jgi:hypothetical protein
MLTESKFDEKFNMLIKEINELKNKITNLEHIILVKVGSIGDVNDYAISNDVIMSNVIDKSINFCEPPLTRQNAFNR